MGIGVDNSCVRCVAINSGLQLFIHYAANDAFRALERNTVTGPVVGVDVGDPSVEQGVYKICFSPLSVLRCWDEVQGLHPSQRKGEEYDEEQGYTQRLNAVCK